MRSKFKLCLRFNGDSRLEFGHELGFSKVLGNPKLFILGLKPCFYSEHLSYRERSSWTRSPNRSPADMPLLDSSLLSHYLLTHLMTPWPSSRQRVSGTRRVHLRDEFSTNRRKLFKPRVSRKSDSFTPLSPILLSHRSFYLVAGTVMVRPRSRLLRRWCCANGGVL